MSLPGRNSRSFEGADWSPPAEFHEYRVLRPLGRGRTGRVFLAHDTLLERTVAVKFVPVESSTSLMRLLNEVRAAARVQHPNIVTLYRVGQLGEHAYIVSEYTRGTSLDRLAKPLPPERLYAFALDLARGLAAAHRAGVLHRDLKPSNAVVTDTGTVKLLDFGLAKLLGPGQAMPEPEVASSEPRPAATLSDVPAVESLSLNVASSLMAHSLPGAGELVGTPYYMSPEAWRREEHTVRSDIYSLGAMLYEFCAGQAPFRHEPLQKLGEAVQTQEARPLAERAPSVDGAFAAAVDRCLRIDPLDRFPSADALLDALESARALPALAEVPEGNPYRGLRAFEREHRALFFGRRRDLRTLRERLRTDHFVLLTGDSGVGKSSLVAAGLLPDIEDGVLADGRSWSTARMVPGHHPLVALAAAIGPALGRDEQSLEVGLRADPESFGRTLRKRLKPDQGLALYLDQLEELLTLSDPSDAARFITAITPLAEGIPGVRLIASIRSDFLTRLGAVPRFGAAAARAIYLVRPLERDELRQAVVGPARITGVRFESEELVEQLVESGASSGGGLPLLQFALAELWDARDAETRVVSASSLAQLGGVAGALAKHADAVIDGLLPEQRVAARSLLLRLVTDDGTRARRTAEELTGDDARYRAALEALVRGRLLVARETDAGATYEVAHEALLSGWGRLATWIAAESETRQVRRRLEAAALEWERLGRRPEALWGPQSVAEASAIAPENLAERERRFLSASRAGLERARRRRRSIALATLGLVVLVGGTVQLRHTFLLRAEVDRELAAAASAHDAAARIISREEQLRAAAYAAFDRGDVESGEKSWSEALVATGDADTRLTEVGAHLERAAALDSDRAEVRTPFGDYLLERAIRAERQGRLDLRELFAQRLAAVDRDGHLQRAFRAPGVLTVAAPGATLRLLRVSRTAEGRFVEEPASVAVRPGEPVELEPGSYVLIREGTPPTRLPFTVGRGEHLPLSLPAAPTMPAGFVFVPEGAALFGTQADESIRGFLGTTPLHPVHTGAFLIARTETTWADYLAFLDALPDGERAARMPHLATSNLSSAFALTRPNGVWTLDIQPGSAPLHAAAGERLHYPGRKVRADVDWLRTPVVGVAFEDVQAYARWLDRSGRVPGARLCTEAEWERAARGADSREYPASERLLPDDADFDVTYGRAPDAMGADEVGSHPASRSPFGVEDMTGNVWEWTTSVLKPGTAVLRGGSYFHDAGTCRVTNRETPDLSYRNMTVGMRLCANSPR